MGTWSVTQVSNIAQRLPELGALLRAKGVMQIRLLGCVTGIPTSEVSFKLLRALSNGLNANLPPDKSIRFYGTTMVLWSDEFDGYGLRDDYDYLSKIDDVKPRTFAEKALEENWFGVFRDAGSPSHHIEDLFPESLAAISAGLENLHSELQWPLRDVSGILPLQRLLQGCARAAYAPGLLALPDAELLYPAKDSTSDPVGRFIRISVFFGGVMIRAIKGGSSVLFEVRDENLRRELLEAITSGTPVPLTI